MEPDARGGEHVRWGALDDMPEPAFAPVRSRATREATGLPARLPVTGTAPALEPAFVTGTDDAATKRGPAKGGRWSHRLAGAGLLTACLGGAALYDHYAGNSGLAVAEPRAEMVMAGTPAGLMQRTPAAPPSDPIVPAVVVNSPAPVSERPPDGTAAPPAPPLSSPPAKAGAKVSRAPSRPAAGFAETEYQLQLAALPTEEAAWQEWNRLRRLHADLLGSLRALGTRVEMADQGTLWRVRVGPIPSAEAAERICAELKRRQAPCLLFIRRS
jgi:cell division septation protein DedD